MTDTRLPTDWEMTRLRDMGLLICHCANPKMVHLPLWDDYQCGRCGRAILWSPDD